MQLESRLYILEPSKSYPFHIAARQYRRNSKPGSGIEKGHEAGDGLTLIAAHSAGSHKESWEPLLEYLFPLADAAGVPILEAWAIDAPTHGDAGTLNEEILQKDCPDTFPFDGYARTISHFLTTGGELENPGVNFANRKLVVLGHCLGAASAVHVQNDPSFPIKFQGMVLVEVLAEPPGTTCPWEMAIEACYLRRDTWSTRDDAFNDFRKDPAYGLWSDKCLEVFVQHGLKDHTAANYDPFPWKGVSSKCTRTQEAATYRGMFDLARLVPDVLPAVSREVPVHCIWAAINPRIYKAIQNAVETQCDVQFASVQKVPKAGHLVIQHNPEAAAQAVLNALKAIWHGSNLHSRL